MWTETRNLQKHMKYAVTFRPTGPCYRCQTIYRTPLGLESESIQGQEY